MVNNDTRFGLYSYADAHANARTFNLRQIEQFFWFQIPEDTYQSSVLYQVDDATESQLIEISAPERFIVRDGHEVWMRVDTSMFSSSIGFHLYKFSFVDTSSDYITPLYFAYTIQDDNPDKPYVYMKPRTPKSVKNDFSNMDDGHRYERR